MAWTYSGNPADSDLDAVRFLSGDTDTNNQQVSDEEIAFLLTEWNDDTYIAAAGVCEAASGKATRQADNSKRVGDLALTTEYSTQAERWMDRARQLRDSAARKNAPKPRYYLTDTDPQQVFGDMKFSIGMDDYR